MGNILISGLKQQGPGDILGAIGGETDIDPGEIGNIEIKNTQALVEIDDSVEKKLARQLDGKNVGSATVSVSILDGQKREYIDQLHSYTSHFRELVDLEREEEMRAHEESIVKLSAEQRESEGKAILHLRGRDEGKALEGRLVKFMRQHRGEPLPETEIAVGDLVMLSRKDPLRDDNPTGTVTQKTNYSITVAFENPPSFIFEKGLRMDLYVNDITYQRMKAALKKLKSTLDRDNVLRDILIGAENPSQPESREVSQWNNTELNESQREAVKRSGGARDIHLIHGPPGTGKTTTVVEVIQQAIENGHTVLATAASNTAVDNLLEFLLEQGAEAVRLGHPARVTPLMKQYTLDKLVQENEQYQRSEEMRDEAFSLKNKQEEYIHPSGRYRRGMSDEKIKSLAEENRGSRGVSAEKIQQMAQWLEMQEEINRLFEKADNLRENAIDQVLDSKQVVCTTNSTAGSELLEGREFDLVVIDEATQATEPSCLIPITRGKKVVMAGDHKQLPPTVKNLDAAEKGLRDTLFERLAERYPDITTMLNVQYRMNTRIMEFSSQQFYEGALNAHESVADHTLEDLAVDVNAMGNKVTGILDPSEPLTFVDTSGIQAAERSAQGSTSKENVTEAGLVESLADNLLRSGIRPEEIAVISPYKDQVDLIDRKMDEENLEIKTVDGFQGREKEVVIISLTRSNKGNEIGFLEDIRRLNVSLTRAKRKLIVIGDRSTIESHESYREFISYVEAKGNVVQL